MTLDMLVVGAGFAGIYQLYKARQAGMHVKVLESASGVGGTWHWNCYPGARCDIESLDYSYSFSRELEEEWVWTERYAAQPEILAYINHVVDRFDLRKDIQLDTKVKEAHYDEQQHVWQVETEDGQQYKARYLVLATGGLSIPQRPQLEGLDSFEGQWYHSARWPREPVDFTGKRVAVIGTGSSGVQMVPLIAQQAKQMTVLQRTANFSVPAHNVPFTPESLQAAKARYKERRAMGREAITGQFLNANVKTLAEMTEAEQQAELEYRWRGAGGGFRMLRAFADQMSNPETNRRVAEFARSKIRAIVKDSRKADILCPKEDLPFGGKRLCVDSHYYETFNQAHVDVIDLRANPLLAATPTGLRLQQGELDCDAIVFATGFDAMTGAPKAIRITGQGGVLLKDKWQDGPISYLGVGVSGFPNMFIIAGPGSPSVLSNMVHSIETHVDWIIELIQQLQRQGKQAVVALPDAEQSWVAHCAEEADKTLYTKANSWYMGSNTPGKPRVFMAYVTGVPVYRRILEGVAENNYEGFAFL